MSLDCESLSDKFQDGNTDEQTVEDGPTSLEAERFTLYLIITALGTILLMLIVFFLCKKCRRGIRPSSSSPTSDQASPPYTLYRGPSNYNGLRDYPTQGQGRVITNGCFRQTFPYNNHPYLPPGYEQPLTERASLSGYSAQTIVPTQVEHLENIHREETSRLRAEAYQRFEQETISQQNTLPLRHHPFQLQQSNPAVVNPLFNIDDETNSVQSGNSIRTNPDDLRIDCLKDLYKLTERSITQTVCGKLVVSVTREVDHHGDILILDNMGISLKVPSGAVKRGETKKIVLVLNWDLSDNPEMLRTECLVSPVVYVGPHNLKLEKPCVLIFRHCSFDPRQIRVMRSETELIEQKQWEALCERTDESLCYLTADECQLTIDTFTLYTCVQAPLDNQVGKKWLQIAVFACPLRKEMDHHQVYIVNCMKAT